MLEDLRPRRILFVTKRCWNATERLGGVTWAKAETFLHDEHREDTGFFGLTSFLPGAYAMSLQHPATPGWSPDWWHLFVKDFLVRKL